MRRRLGFGLVLALVSSACTGGPPKDGAQVLELDGTVLVSNEGTWEAVAGDALLPDGSRVRLEGDARLRMETAEGFIYVLPIGGSDAEFVLEEGGLELDRGDLLIDTADEQAYRAMVRGVEVRIAGTVRVTRSLSVRVAAYEGGALAVVAGATLEIPAFREAILGPSALPDQTSPLRLDPEDAFDGVAASDLLNLDRELAALGTGYEAQFGSRIPRLARLEPVREDAGAASFAFVEPVLSSWRAGDVIVGVVLAIMLSARGDGALPTMFGQVRSRFGQGASWAVIVAGFGLPSTTVNERVARAVALITGAVEPGRGDPISEPPEPSPTPTATPSPKPTSTSRPTGSPTPTRTPTPSETPSPTPSATPTPSVTPTPTPTVPPPPTGSCQPVDQLLGNC